LKARQTREIVFGNEAFHAARGADARVTVRAIDHVHGGAASELRLHIQSGNGIVNPHGVFLRIALQRELIGASAHRENSGE
jgi:hypothetical protein